jgi:hypothetical protein
MSLLVEIGVPLHVLGASEPDPVCAVAECLDGVRRGVSIRTHVQPVVNQGSAYYGVSEDKL